MKKTGVFLIAVLALGLVSTALHAEDSFNAQLFQPSIFGGNFVAIEDANTLCPLGLGAGLLFNYANGPLQLLIDDEPETGVLNSLVTADVLFAFGPTSWWSIGVDMPVHLYTRGRSLEDQEADDMDMDELTSGTVLGDLRAEFKFRLLRQDLHWLGMALAPYATFPTGEDESFLGEGRITGGGNLILEHDFSIFNIGLNGGYLYRGDAELAGVNLGDAWRAGAGLSRDFGPVSFSLEWQARWLDSGSVDAVASNPMEGFGTLRYKFGSNRPRLIGGAAGGMTSGVGSPAYRLLAGLDYYHCWPEPTMGDLEVRVVDENNNPLIADLTVDGPTKKAAGTASSGLWKSELDPGDYEIAASKDGYQPGSAKAAVTLGETTKKTIVLQKVPTHLTVIVTAKATGKKIPADVVFDLNTPSEKTLNLPDGEASQPWAPGGYKLLVSSKGYEDKQLDIKVLEGEKNVVSVVLRKKIEQIGKIYFDYDSDVIRTQSYPVLDNVVEQINELESWKSILIEGHCSSEGSDAYNLDLSDRRAKSVKNYLIKKGVDGTKLQVKGYGESKPIATNDTDEGREKNRRVEFIIEE